MNESQEFQKAEKNLIFDATILNELQLCGMRYFLGHELHLRLPQVAEPLEEGDMLHRMMESYYEKVKKNPTSVMDRFDEIVEESIQEGQAYAANNLSLPPAETNEVVYQFIEQAKHNRLDGIEVLEVEKPFIITLFSDGELAIHYAGKIDLLANVPQFGRCVIDHKSMRRSRDPLSLSNQFTGYATAMDVDYVIVNKIGFQKTLKPHERFRRYPLFYTEDRKKRWKANTIYWGQQLAFYISTNTWPENRTSCDKYNGCIYIPICEANTQEAREWTMKAQFIEGSEWDVTSVLKGKK